MTNEREQEFNQTELIQTVLKSGYTYAAMGIGAASLFVSQRYHVSSPNRIIAKTGPFVKGPNGISVHKNTFQLPFQKIHSLSLNPKTYNFVSKAMSKETLELELPTSFTIGPKSGNSEALQYYSEKFCGLSEDHIEEIIQEVIEGSVRMQIGSLLIDQIFSDKVAFREAIQTSIEKELEPLGLVVINSNIKELQDTEGSEYFTYRRKKATEGAMNNAKIEVAEAKKIGDIGEKERQTETRINVAQLEAKAIHAENESTQQIETSKAELEKKKADLKKEVEIAQIESNLAAKLREQELNMAVDLKNEELQTGVQIKRQEQELERLRAIEITKAKVEAERLVRESQGRAESIRIEADGNAQALIRQKQGETQAIEMEAQAETNARKMKAEARLIEELKMAEGIRANLQSTALGLEEMTKACGGDFNNVLQQMMIEKNVYAQLAESNAKAIHGLNPKITYWNTSGGSNQSNPIGDIFTNLPPLLSTIKEQTGIELPEWLIKMPPVEEKALNKMKKQN